LDSNRFLTQKLITSPHQRKGLHHEKIILHCATKQEEQTVKANQEWQGLAGKVIVGGCQQKAQELKGEMVVVRGNAFSICRAPLSFWAIC
jgi:hypothetical protein